ncbi:MAG: hypothetical protein FD171_1227 [Actinobacteria bacterium]|nr:MAG: hypothetical protein FD171_1227 [Actinomycetota bacterium]
MAEVLPQQFLVDIKSILDELADSVVVDVEFPLEPLVIGTESFVPVSRARVEVTVTYTGTGQVVALGRVEVDVSTHCSRCLTEFTMTASGDVEGFYVKPGHDDEIPEEQEVEFITDRSIDILPAIRSALILELPFAPLHDESCPGICLTCGADLADGACDCEPVRADSPFAALQGLVAESDDTA